MVSGRSHQEEEKKTPTRLFRVGATRSLEPAFSQSMSNSGGSVTTGSPSTLRLTHLNIHDDQVQPANLGNKKKRGQRATGGDKNRGLRQFSLKVCEKVESKGRTTQNEVADELVAEFVDPCNSLTSPDQQHNEKNIRRRVYDALNVLMALNIISKEKKEIQWRGFPRTTLQDIEELEVERVNLRNIIEKKAAYLKELEEQYMGLHNLIKRNKEVYGSGNVPTGGVALPFILVQARPHATVVVEISEDMQLVHFDFNSTPFELHDDNHVLKAMGFCERQLGEDGVHAGSTIGGESSEVRDAHLPDLSCPLRSNAAARPPTSHPLP